MQITTQTWQGRPLYRLETTDWIAECLPDLGGKVITFLDRHSGRQWLWRNPRQPYRKLPFGSDYGNSDSSGIDECFPAVAPGPYPAPPWAGRPIADHGEIWSATWAVVETGPALRTQVTGVEFPYLFERSLEVGPGRGLLFRYRVRNLGDAPFLYCWAAHAIWAPTPGMRLVVPEPATVRLNGATGAWPVPIPPAFRWSPAPPIPSGEDGSLGVVPPPAGAVGRAAKLFLTDLQAGWVGLYDPATDSHLRLQYDPAQLNTLGLWLNWHGWQDYYHLGVEPAIGTVDDLTGAQAQGTARALAPQGVHEWWWELLPGAGSI
ncbi:MAG TPA: hypothetical protein VKY74_24685 [Chloroflexia bacterium]|nr:hypothetical protein [Chloroflexia bacterium]